jgi:hypothetical protein
VRLALATALAALLLLAGCGSSGPGATPASCLVGVEGYLKALEAAPSPVLLGGTTPIGDCLPDDQSGADQATVGESLVRAATLLNAEGRRDPEGPAPLRLGYLVGAVLQVTGGATGIHADLIRRIESAAGVGQGTPSKAFELAYARGYAAGRSQG